MIRQFCCDPSDDDYQQSDVKFNFNYRVRYFSVFFL